MSEKSENFVDKIIKFLFLIAILSVAYLYKSLMVYIPVLRITKLKLFVMMLIFAIIMSIKILREYIKRRKLP
jgi:hypothetical protein